MPWVQLKFPASSGLAPRLAEALEQAGASAVSIESAADEVRFALADESVPLWSNNWVTGLFPGDTDPAAIVQQLVTALGHDHPPAPRVETLADEDWAQTWKAHYRPIEVSSRLWICPSWIAPPHPDAINILIDPGLAFGTGTHATTLLCLRWLARQTLAERSVIDYGCGSGILAIAALRLGAQAATGVDVDPVALTVARDNAGRNRVRQRLRLSTPDGLEPGMAADIVLANILANPLIDLAARLTAMVRPGGQIVLSGMLSNQVSEVSEHYIKAFDLEQEFLDDWAILQGRKRP